MATTKNALMNIELALYTKTVFQSLLLQSIFICKIIIYLYCFSFIWLTSWSLTFERTCAHTFVFLNVMHSYSFYANLWSNHFYFCTFCFQNSFLLFYCHFIISFTCYALYKYPNDVLWNVLLVNILLWHHLLICCVSINADHNELLNILFNRSHFKLYSCKVCQSKPLYLYGINNV